MTKPIADPGPLDPLARGLFLPNRGLSMPRALVAVGGAAAALLALVLDHHDLGLFGWIEASVLGVATVAMLFDRVLAHVFVRSVLWGVLVCGVLEVLTHSPWAALGEPARAFTLLLGAASSLLALGRAGLDGEHGAFFPLVMRRSLLTMMVVGLCVAHVMTVLSVGVSMGVWSLMATSLVTPGLLVAGVVGLSRTRSWGLFVFLASLVTAAGSVALFAFPPAAWTAAEVSYVPRTMILLVGWALGGFAAFLASLPVLAALVIKPRPRSIVGGWGQHVHAAIVVAVVGLTVCVALA